MEDEDLQEFPDGHATEGYIACDRIVRGNSNGTTTNCFKPYGHSDNIHEDYNGNTVVDTK